MSSVRAADSIRLAEVLAAHGLAGIEKVLLNYLPTRRWFGSKARSLTSLSVLDAVPVPGRAIVCLIEARYPDGTRDIYCLPLATVVGDDRANIAFDWPDALVASTDAGCVIYDPSSDPAFCREILHLISGRQQLRGASGVLAGSHTSAFERMPPDDDGPHDVRHSGDEQSNTSVLLDQSFVLKLVRRPAPGPNVEIEMRRFLTDRAQFRHAAPLAGALEYRPDQGPAMILAVLHGFIPNHGTAWVQAVRSAAGEPASPPDYSLLGRRTGEMHASLSRDDTDPAFAPEPFTTARAQASSDRMRALAQRVFDLLPGRLLGAMTVGVKLDLLLSHRGELERTFQLVASLGNDGACIRCHGDYHLGQVLWTGQDYVIIDFEGEPARAPEARGDKDLPLRDVAGIVRSFGYAASTGLSSASPDRRAALASTWCETATATFLSGYLSVDGVRRLLPTDEARLSALLRAYVLEKAVYELGYELNNRPDWAHIPVEGLLSYLDPTGRSYGSPTA